MDESHSKSAVSAVGRGLVGGFILGPVGLLAGLSAKSKGTHVVAIQFKDGKKSLIEMDEKIYKALLKACF
jgi:threonine dehydrogenase-like Zn-dependent dehydrogenase